MRRIRILLLLGLGVCLAAPTATAADAELAEMLRALRAAREPSKRLAVMEAVMRKGGNAVARTLARLAEKDPDIRVRAKAARLLGAVDASEAGALAEALVKKGGPRLVRLGAAYALRRQGPTRALTALARARTQPLDALLLLRSLHALRDPESRALLLRMAEDHGSLRQSVAIETLARRKDDRTARIAFLIQLMGRAKDTDALLTLMDAAEAVVDPLMKPVLDRLKTFLNPDVQAGADHLLELIAIQEMKRKRDDALEKLAQKKQAKKEKSEYGNKEDVPEGEGEDDVVPPTPPPPPIRSRHDLVYVLDVTGSTWGELPRLVKRMHQEVELLIRQGGSVRVGVVAYGAGRTKAGKRFQVLPLTFDRDRMRAFFDGLRSGGVDDLGAAVASGLREALDRMPWRWTARRTVQLFADSDVDNQGMAKAVVSIHKRADGTRTRVAYVLRTRSKVPAAYFELAKIGGSGTPEVID